jgi:phosphoglycolate phosphatase-like HAD superfamily hydrolase
MISEAGGISPRRPVVVFDYDGTLIDAYDIKRESYWLAVSEALNLRPEDRLVVEASYARTSGAHRDVQLADSAGALERTVTPEERDHFSRLYTAHNELAKDRMREFPSARRVLLALKAGCDLVLASGLPHDLLLADVSGRGLGEMFAEIEGGDKGRTLARLQQEGRRVLLLVGDTTHDEGVARAHRVAFYRITGDGDLARLPETLAGGLG